NTATGLIIDNILLANTSINGVGIQNAILPAGTYYFLIEGELSTEYTVDIRLASDVEDDDTEDINEFANAFNFYPNPVNDRLYIETQTLAVEIYDIFGRQQDNKTTRQQGNLSVDVSNLNRGIYFVKVMTENGEIVKKFVKE
ncbi:MAG: T9SS type A sorting domain-containing protein, partial [Bacteroidales bacterium]|nr:T9SS type A sorting domain-containing protein [Bacteroidales bacterium]